MSKSLKVICSNGNDKTYLCLVLTADRGLCGGFNSNITKEVRNLLSNKYADANVEIKFLGKKAYEFFKRADFTKDTSDMEAFLELNADDVFKIGDSVIEDFIAGKYDEVRVVYNKFKNAATQIIMNEQFLPIVSDQNKEEKVETADYIFEPSKAKISFTIIPRAVKTQLYRTMLDSQASEHGSRMVAMDKATENAGDIIYDLKLQYNQARQAAITTEILEIVGGAAALEG